MEPVLFSLPEAAWTGVLPVTSPSPAGCAPPWRISLLRGLSAGRGEWESVDRGRPAASVRDLNPNFSPQEGAERAGHLLAMLAT